MMRSLWTAASGMIAQQNNVDTIANNLSNVNTIGYKTQTAEFKSLLYQEIVSKTTSANGENKPVGAQVGLGVRNSSITSHYRQGGFQTTNEPLDFAINGDGFFAVRTLDGNVAYTRNGNFYLAVAPGDSHMLTDSEGLAILDTDGEPIYFDDGIKFKDIVIDTDGEVCLPDASGNPQRIGVKLALYQFSNPSGLEKGSNGLLLESEASGVPMSEDEYTNLKKSVIKQGYLEMSNVQVADEMVNLIVAQRAYELNSKAITTSDEMMQTANNLKR
ncbi:MAG: flagellar hook-basal body protein [Alistipes sp.]|nr:flagellar hook-basal body protein [Alistipes sp.]